VPEARPYLERALLIREKTFGPDHLLVAQSLSNLAYYHALAGQYAPARPLLERAMAIRERSLGPSDPLVEDTRSRLEELRKLLAE
jgi:hypothetical protein